MKLVLVLPVLVLFALLFALPRDSKIEDPVPSLPVAPPERTAPLRIGPPPNWGAHIGEGRFFNPNCPHCQLPEAI